MAGSADALFARIREGREVFWINGASFEDSRGRVPGEGVPGLSPEDVEEASARWKRFAPLLARLFPELEASRGIIESPLRPLPAMAQRGNDYFGSSLEGQLFLKCDSHLPVSGSIKARGGIYEVLCHAEKLAMKEKGFRREQDYGILGESAYREFFSRYALAVGSTGNLGMSIGIMGTALGFRVTVHMSRDAREWKKELLRARGAAVVEHGGDYGKAVAAGRAEAEADPRTYFVDDESSKTLFLGYAVAAERLAEQLQALKVAVDREHPLFVYLPCGVGGAPGGITLGLSQIFGQNVHCFFAEPLQAPCVLLGMASGKYENVSAGDFGLSGKTEADGLAVGRMSSLVGPGVGPWIRGVYTLEDRRLYELLALLGESEELFLEPSALAGMPGPWLVESSPEGREMLERWNLREKMHRASHIVWATGGSLVPPAIMASFVERGRRTLPFRKN